MDRSPKVGKEGSSGWYAVCANWKAMMLKIRMLANPTSAIPLTGEIVYMSDRAPKNPQDKVDNEPSTETGITLALSNSKMAATSKYDSHSHMPQGSSSLTI